MKKLLFLVTAAVLGLSASAAWTYDATEGTITDNVWTFGATVKNGTELTVNAVQIAPSEVSPLDFSQLVSDGSTVYMIVTLNPQFGSRAATWGNPEDFVGTPEGAKVGALSLPASGLTEISNCAFAFCSNATGVVSLSSDLVKIGNAAFDHCDGITGFNPLVPDSVTSIGDFAFAYTAPAQDVSLKNVATITYGLFTETPITSVYFGPAFKKFTNMNYKNGTFLNCTSLTNVTFDPAISGAQWMGGTEQGQSTFSGCSALEGVLDLSGFTKLYSQWGNFGCGKVKGVIISENIEAIDMNFFNGLTALEYVLFKGPPPTTLGLPIYSGVKTANNKSYKFATYIYEDYKDDWLAYAKDGVINYDDSEFDASKITSGLATSMRPLRFYPPSAPIIDSVVASGATSNEVAVAVTGSALCGGSILVEILDEQGHVAVSLSTNDFGVLAIGGLEILTKYSVRVTASNGVGVSVDASARFETTDGPGAELNEVFKVGRHDWVFRFRRTGGNKFRAPAKMVGPAKLLVVGGGGGGGGFYGGGGGGGGVLYRDDVILTPGASYTIKVGAGGQTDVADGATAGGESYFLSGDSVIEVRAPGGGRGPGGWNKRQGGAGANGGGGCNGGVGGIPVEGYDGYAGGAAAGTAGGGGGGAGGPGGDAHVLGTQAGGQGGPGVTNVITGVEVVYGYGGGGAGEWWTGQGHYGRGGALNGYGDSYKLLQNAPGYPATPGEDGTGGGGGAGCRDTSCTGANGGSGVVIIRYTEQPMGMVIVVR